MKKVVLGFLFGGLLALTAPAHGQSEPVASIESIEQVSNDNTTATLYLRALDWAENHFTKLPKTAFKPDASAHEVRVTGTSKVTPVTVSGKEQPMVVYFDFIFKTTSQGYDYRVTNFKIVTTTGKTVETKSLEEYITQLTADHNDPKTHNARRVTAQANSLASEVALSFRSYMNNTPVTEEGTVGLPATEH
ncbi:DUF4468 domain-containing protein [Hymenobacter crusticola]|uniref:DUF4468 domain-containing protein n=1 Tax=Hymenobacter crusticola TaxID=1770526 RepID=A0A243WIX2_9BACT|nr:DUF4468 domain-containing protein [Hymenobacter crusticola]OUJ75853.1 hypothetical protein BXP70_00715 [Hymenobacter crusticola]